MVIVLAYGYEAYAAGLWIINKHGELSDGRSLSDVWMGVWGAVMVVSLMVSTLPAWVFFMLLDRTAEKKKEVRECDR